VKSPTAVDAGQLAAQIARGPDVCPRASAGQFDVETPGCRGPDRSPGRVPPRSFWVSALPWATVRCSRPCTARVSPICDSTGTRTSTSPVTVLVPRQHVAGRGLGLGDLGRRLGGDRAAFHDDAALAADSAPPQVALTCTPARIAAAGRLSPPSTSPPLIRDETVLSAFVCSLLKATNREDRRGPDAADLRRVLRSADGDLPSRPLRVRSWTGAVVGR